MDQKVAAIINVLEMETEQKVMNYFSQNGKKCTNHRILMVIIDSKIASNLSFLLLSFCKWDLGQVLSGIMDSALLCPFEFFLN